jgi:hypothetical protein
VDVETTSLVIDVSGSEIYAHLRPTVIWVSEEGLDGNVYRKSVKGWNAAIGNTPVSKVFIRKLDGGFWTRIMVAVGLTP